MVRRVAFFASVLMTAMAAAAAAQEPPPVPPPATPVAAPPAQEPLPTVAAPPAQAPVTQAAQPAPLSDHIIRERRKHIFMMEGMFVGAVRGAAQDIAERMPNEIGAFPMLTGSLTARGFMLEGYGVFFAVEIPGVVPSVASLQLQRRRLEQGERETQPAQPLRTADSAATAPASIGDAQYVDLVKNALIDAMVDYSKPLDLQPYEWLTVAAADGDEPLNPALLAQRSTLVLRVRGSDIADYLAGRLTKDAVRKKVEVRKF